MGSLHARDTPLLWSVQAGDYLFCYQSYHSTCTPLLESQYCQKRLTQNPAVRQILCSDLLSTPAPQRISPGWGGGIFSFPGRTLNPLSA